MAELTSKSLNAAPTNFHKWLGELHNMGKLLRVYTQNIDGLEMKAGLATYPNQQAGPRMQTSSNCCISLHGSLQRLRCISCSDTFLTETYIDLLHQGVFPRCSSCIKSAKIRQLEGKRPLSVPIIRPDIVLYGEPFNPAEGEITSIANQDRKTVDLLLVVGTSLHIPGTREIVRIFSEKLRERVVREGNGIRSIFINMEKFRGGGLVEKYFDAWVKGDCQEFACMMMEDKELHSVQEMAKEYALTRQDSRPLWRYY